VKTLSPELVEKIGKLAESVSRWWLKWHHKYMSVCFICFIFFKGFSGLGFFFSDRNGKLEKFMYMGKRVVLWIEANERLEREKRKGEVQISISSMLYK
jgi:hypothetical protein